MKVGEGEAGEWRIGGLEGWRIGGGVPGEEKFMSRCGGWTLAPASLDP